MPIGQNQSALRENDSFAQSSTSQARFARMIFIIRRPAAGLTLFC